MWTCENCGAQNEDQFCSNCGTKRPAAQAPAQQVPASEQVPPVWQGAYPTAASPAPMSSGAKAKRSRKALIIILAALLCLVVAAGVVCLCFAGKILKVTLSDTTLKLDVGEDGKLSCKVERFLQGSRDEKVAWDYNKKIVSIDDDGTVHAVDEGRTTVKATPKGATEAVECDIRVSYPEITLGGKTFKSNVDTLDLSNSGVKDLSSLAVCAKLTTLNISGNPVENISVLSSLKSLQEVDASGTSVTDISPLAALPNLKTVHLNNTAVKDISSLKPGVYVELSSAQPFRRDLKLEYGQDYTIKPDDFALLAGGRNISWTTDDTTSCKITDGKIVASGTQRSLGVTSRATVVGKIDNTNISFVFDVSIGSTTYTTNFADKTSLMNCNTYPYAISPQVTGCYGFTITCTAEATQGNPFGTPWYVMVKTNDGKWITAATVTLQSGVKQAINVTFDQPTGFSQVAIVPDGNLLSGSCVWNISYELSNLIFKKD